MVGGLAVRCVFVYCGFWMARSWVGGNSVGLSAVLLLF